MKRRNFYKIALCFPLLFPLIIYAADYVLKSDPGLSLPGGIFTVIGISANFGGIQYIVFAIGLLIWGRDLDADAMKRISWKLPVYFIPVLLIGMVILRLPDPAMYSPPTRIAELLPIYAIMTVSAFVLGYFYVLLTHGLVTILGKLRLITD